MEAVKTKWKTKCKRGLRAGSGNKEWKYIVETEWEKKAEIVETD